MKEEVLLLCTKLFIYRNFGTMYIGKHVKILTFLTKGIAVLVNFKLALAMGTCHLPLQGLNSRCCCSSEEAMASHSSTLAWKIPWTEESDRLQPMGLQELDTTEQHTHISLIVV